MESYIISWRRRTKARINKLKKNGCILCGYNTYLSSLDFHHINTKSFNISYGLQNGLSWESICDEIEKCVLLCANCHRAIHSSELTLPTTIKPIQISLELRNYSKKKCKTCGSFMPNIAARTYCSNKCRGKAFELVEWDNVDLLDLKTKYSNVEIGSLLGVSEATIRKHLKKIQGGEMVAAVAC